MVAKKVLVVPLETTKRDFFFWCLFLLLLVGLLPSKKMAPSSLLEEVAVVTKPCLPSKPCGKSVEVKASSLLCAAAEQVKKGEDKWCMVNYAKSNSSFYGLFDGHGGSQLAAELAQKMAKYLRRARTEYEIVDAYYAIDAELGPALATEGATAACAQVERTETSAKVILSWVGDSRLIAVDMASKTLVWQSSMHHVTNPDEIERLRLHWQLREKKGDDPIEALVEDTMRLRSESVRSTSSFPSRRTQTKSPAPMRRAMSSSEALKQKKKLNKTMGKRARTASSLHNTTSEDDADEKKTHDDGDSDDDDDDAMNASSASRAPPMVFDGVLESGAFASRRDRAVDLTDFLERGQRYERALKKSDEDHGIPLKRATSFVGRRTNAQGRVAGPNVLQSVWNKTETNEEVMGASTCVTRSIGDWDSSRCLLPHPDIAVDNMIIDNNTKAIWKRYVLASDGLWDVLSPRQVAKIVAQEPTCALAADALIANARKKYLKLLDKSKPTGTDPFKDDTTTVVFDVQLGDQAIIPAGPHLSLKRPTSKKRLPMLC